jgi:hypothetical protein
MLRENSSRLSGRELKQLCGKNTNLLLRTHWEKFCKTLKYNITYGAVGHSPWLKDAGKIIDEERASKALHDGSNDSVEDVHSGRAALASPKLRKRTQGVGSGAEDFHTGTSQGEAEDFQTPNASSGRQLASGGDKVKTQQMPRVINKSRGKLKKTHTPSPTGGGQKPMQHVPAETVANSCTETRPGCGTEPTTAGQEWEDTSRNWPRTSFNTNHQYNLAKGANAQHEAAMTHTRRDRRKAR